LSSLEFWSLKKIPSSRSSKRTRRLDVEKKAKLKPCPFCGGKSYLYEEKVRTRGMAANPLTWYQAYCDEAGCPIESKTAWFDTREGAIAAWNRRKP
jgi:Lar family restriction alleviation protein